VPSTFYIFDFKMHPREIILQEIGSSRWSWNITEYIGQGFLFGRHKQTHPKMGQLATWKKLLQVGKEWTTVRSKTQYY
jgi:hypothetical protein